MTPADRTVLLTAIANPGTYCSRCGHEAYDDERHHGMHVMDYHHLPERNGPRPQGFGSARVWFHEPGYKSIVVDYTAPNGERQPVRVWHEKGEAARREAITVEEFERVRKAREALQ